MLTAHEQGKLIYCRITCRKFSLIVNKYRCRLLVANLGDKTFTWMKNLRWNQVWTSKNSKNSARRKNYLQTV